MKSRSKVERAVIDAEEVDTEEVDAESIEDDNSIEHPRETAPTMAGCFEREMWAMKCFRGKASQLRRNQFSNVLN